VREDRADVEEHLSADVDDADLDELVDGMAQQAGGDEDEGNARPPEERGEVQAVASRGRTRRRGAPRSARPISAPTITEGASAVARRGCAWPVRNRRGLDTLADDRDEGEDLRARRPDPLSRARSTDACSSPFTLAAWRRIQKSIHVTTDAARIIVSASNSCSYGSWKLPTVANRDYPENGGGADCQRGADEYRRKEAAVAVFARYAQMIATISAASTPSRGR
jgi:hypothetical protein